MINDGTGSGSDSSVGTRLIGLPRPWDDVISTSYCMGWASIADVGDNCQGGNGRDGAPDRRGV